MPHKSSVRHGGPNPDAKWHQQLLPAVAKCPTRLPRSVHTVARTLCDMAAASHAQLVFAGGPSVARRAARNNHGAALHRATVYAGLALLVEHGFLEKVATGSWRRGQKRLATTYRLGPAARKTLGRVKGFASRCRQTAPPVGDYVSNPMKGDRGLPDPTRTRGPERLDRLLGEIRYTLGLPGATPG